MPGYCLYFVEATPLFLSLRSMADDQVPCHQGSVVATNPLRQNIPVVVTIVTICLRMKTPRAVKSQAIADLLAQFPGEGEFLLDDEVPGEVAMAEEVREQWVIKFNGSSTT